MAIIVVEQDLDAPKTPEDVSRLLRSSEGCMALNGVRAIRHYLSADGQRLTGLFDAPDAEAVRRAIRPDASGWAARVWAASSVETTTPGRGRVAGSRSLVVVERSHATPTALEAVRPSKETLWLCFELRDVRHVATYAALDGMRVVCVFDAPDAETVRVANRNAGMAFDVAWSAAWIAEHGLAHHGDDTRRAAMTGAA
jgi:hypothetical protein